MDFIRSLSHLAIFHNFIQIAEERKSYAQVKEEEVKLLERSIEELECTVNALQEQVGWYVFFLL